MVKTSPSNVGGAGLVSGQGAKTPHASGPERKPKTHNRSNVVANSIKTLKKDPRQEKSLKKIHQTALIETVNPVMGPDLPKHQCAKSQLFP